MTSTESLPQPHEGVRDTGAPRAGDPMVESLEAKLVVLDLTRQLYMTTLVKHPAPLHERLLDRMTHPRPGDLVVVGDVIRRGSEDDHWKGVGYLVVVRQEEYEPEAWYIQYGPEPADICRWVNCEVLAVPLRFR